MLQSCANILLEDDDAALGLSKADKKKFIEKLDTFVKKSKARPPDGFNMLNQQTQKIIRQLRDDYRMQVEIKYHDELRNIVIKQDLVDSAMNTDSPLEYLLKKLEGGIGQRLSIDYQGKANGGRLVSMFLNDLEKENLIDTFRNGKLQDEIFNDLYIVYKEAEEKGFVRSKYNWSGNEQAKGIAELIYKYDRISVGRLNSANGRIILSPDRIMNKAPDHLKIRALGKNKEEAYKAFKKLSDEHMNLEEMFSFIPETHREAELKGIFENYWNGHHIKSIAGDDTNLNFMNPMNLGRSISKKSKILFKDGRSAKAFLDSVGHKNYNIQHAITFGLEHDGRNHALLNNLGTNPEAMIRSVVDMIKSRMKPNWDNYNKKSRDLAEQSYRDGIPKKIKDSLEILDGTNRSPLNVKMAAISSSVRAIKNMSLLGFATIRSLNDVITMSFTAKKDGIPWASIIKQAPRNFIDNFELPGLGIRPNAQKRKIAALIGLGPRALVADVVGKFGADDSLPGFMTKLQRNYFKMNLLTYWNDAMKTSYSMMLSHHLATHAHHAYNSNSQLPEIRRLLDDFNFSPQEWDVVRNSATWTADDGKLYMSPDRLDTEEYLSDDDIVELIRQERGPKDSLEEISFLMEDSDPEEQLRIHEKTVAQHKKRIKESIAKLKTKLTKEEREQVQKNKIRYEGRLDLIEKNKALWEGQSKGELTPEEISKFSDIYFNLSDKKLNFEKEANKALIKYYNTKDHADEAMINWLEGMDTRMRDEFEKTFAQFWKGPQEGWGVEEMRYYMSRWKEHVPREKIQDPSANAWLETGPTKQERHKDVSMINFINKELGEKKIPANLDPAEKDWLNTYTDKQKKKVWGEFLRIVSHDEEHINALHKEIQRAWAKEGEFLFKGHKIIDPEKGEVWRAPAAFPHMKSLGIEPKGKMWEKAIDLERQSQLLQDDLPKWFDDYIKAYVAQEVKPIDVLRKRNDLATKLTTLFYDRNDHAVLIPGAKEKRIMTQGARSGTILGEAVRFIGQFKTFPVTLMTKSIMDQTGGKPFSKAGLYESAKFIAGMTAMGAITTVATDFLRNKTTRDTFDPTSGEFMDFTSEAGFKNLVDSFIYGGGAGFYGDIVAHPYGSSQNFSAIKSLLGPTFSQYDDVMDVTLGLLNGDKKAKKFYNFMLQNTPYQNLFYSKTAFDYLLNYQMQDIIDPGYHYKQWSRMQREKGQGFRNTPVGIFQ
tara:strand:+ start:6284 stop:9934 length:3651 start_codon:yes stop_codon:yes gene_type:complete